MSEENTKSLLKNTDIPQIYGKSIPTKEISISNLQLTNNNIHQETIESKSIENNDSPRKLQRQKTEDKRQKTRQASSLRRRLGKIHPHPHSNHRPETGVDDLIGQRCPLPSLSTRPFFALFQTLLANIDVFSHFFRLS